MDQIRREVAYAIRSLVRTRAVAVSAVVSIALGIGASTAIFAVASTLFFRPLPYADADRLVILWNRSPGLGIAEDWFSTAQYFDITRGHKGFDQVAIAIGANDTLTGDGEPERLGTIRMSSTLLPMLGVTPAMGRLFTAADDEPGAAPAAILGHGTWLRRYGGDVGVLGRTLTINGQPYQVVGVLPATFRLPREVMPTLDGAEDAEVVLPLPLAAAAADVRTHEDYNLLAKLRPGVTVEAAQAEMDTITARLRRDHPEVYPPNGGLTFGIVPLADQVVGAVRGSVALLSGAVLCVLLIACANVANLLLARGLSRDRELAVRQAIGAGRARIVRELLTEALLLGLAGGLVGTVLAVGLVQAIRLFGEGTVPRLHEVSVDPYMMAFAAACSLAAALLFGGVPAWRAAAPDLFERLKEGVRGAGHAAWGRGQHARRLLVVAELALSVMLLVAAGLLVRSFITLHAVDPGFDPRGVLTFELTMSGRRYGDAERVIDGYRRLWPELSRLPGVTDVGAISALPLSQMYAWGPITVEGRTPPPGEQFINVDMRMAAAGYFGAMRIPLVSGRLFDTHDTRDAGRVAVVDTLMASQLWPGVSPIGKRIRIGGADSPSPWVTVVGVVSRVKQYALDADSRMAIYLPHAQFPMRPMNIVVRTDADPADLAGAVRRALATVDPDLPMYHVRTMEERVSQSVATRRFALLLLVAFAAAALGLAAVGIAGVLGYMVRQSSRELGIRAALGATPRALVRFVVGHGLALAATGLATGCLIAVALSRAIAGQLFGITPMDPLTYGLAVATLMFVALVACYGPARRASRIDPLAAIRND